MDGFDQPAVAQTELERVAGDPIERLWRQDRVKASGHLPTP
jgi:hypothetical protein